MIRKHQKISHVGKEAKKCPMRVNFPTTVQLGELVAAVYDEAVRYGFDQEEISCLAAKVVMHMVNCSGKNFVFCNYPLKVTRLGGFFDAGNS